VGNGFKALSKVKKNSTSSSGLRRASSSYEKMAQNRGKIQKLKHIKKFTRKASHFYSS